MKENFDTDLELFDLILKTIVVFGTGSLSKRQISWFWEKLNSGEELKNAWETFSEPYPNKVKDLQTYVRKHLCQD